MQSQEVSELPCRYRLSYMFDVLRKRLRRLCSGIHRWVWIWRRPKAKVVIKRFRKMSSTTRVKEELRNNSARPIRLASFNTALFSLAPAIPKAKKSIIYVHDDGESHWKNSLVKSANVHPKSILKQSPLHQTINDTTRSDQPFRQNNVTKSKSRVSINLPENEITLARNKVLSIVEDSSNNFAPMRSPICFSASMNNWMNDESLSGSRTIYDVLKEVDADIIALQDVKAEEEKNMRPLSDLAHALGMKYVFAESWAPEYGNAILSKWPIKRWKIQKIYDDRDFRNVLKATIDVPWAGELNFYCTQLDHLDESWRMKQINAIIQSNDHPHILAGGLNSLDGSDYSSERWTDIVKYYEQIGKPTPKVEVMNFLKGKKFIDPKDFAGECEPVVIIAKGQNVQGTCKYGTRVDYVLSSPSMPYKFVPGSYSVISSKGTSDHHLVKVDVIKVAENNTRKVIKKHKKKVQKRVVRFTNSCSSGEI